MSSCIERPRTTCSLGGALSTISALSGVIPISHTTSGCAGNLSGTTAFNSGYCGSNYCSGQSVPVSNFNESNVVFGGAGRLREELISTFELIDGKLYIVLTGCMSEIIADDVQGVVSEFQNEGKPLIYVNTPSFEGDAFEGYELVLDKIINDHLPVSSRKDKSIVNVFGIVPQFDPFFRGDLGEIKRILERLGLRVNTLFTNDQTYKNLTDVPKAGLNILLSPVYGVDLLKKFEKRHGTPFITEDLPVGAIQTEAFIRHVAKALDIDSATVNRVIKEEKRDYYAYLERAADLISDSEFKYYTDVVGNATGTLSYARFLRDELGFVVENSVITDFLPKKKEKILKGYLEGKDIPGNLSFETDTYQVTKLLKNAMGQPNGDFYIDLHTPRFVFGSTFEKDYAVKNALPYLAISYPVYDRTILSKGYAGFRGGLQLMEDILCVLVAGR